MLLFLLFVMTHMIIPLYAMESPLPESSILFRSHLQEVKDPTLGQLMGNHGIVTESQPPFSSSIPLEKDSVLQTWHDLRSSLVQQVFDAKIYKYFPLYASEIVPLCLKEISVLKKVHPWQAAHLVYRTCILMTHIRDEHPDREEFLAQLSSLSRGLPTMIVQGEHILFKSTQ